MTHVQVLVWDLRDYNGGSWLTAEEGHTSTGNAKLDAKLRLKVTHQLTFLYRSSGLLMPCFRACAFVTQVPLEKRQHCWQLIVRQ